MTVPTLGDLVDVADVDTVVRLDGTGGHGLVGMRERVGLLRGLGVAALQSTYDERVRLNPGARTTVRTMAANGARCVLVSGGFTFFTERVAKDSGFHANRANTLIEGILGAALSAAASVDEPAADFGFGGAREQRR